MKRSYTSAFKAQLVKELLKETKPIGQLAAEHGIHPNVLNTWKASALQGLPSLFCSTRTTAPQRSKPPTTSRYKDIYV